MLKGSLIQCAAELTGRNPGFSFEEDTDDLFVGKTLLHGMSSCSL